VIKIISLGTEEKPVNKKREGEGSTKKNKPTLALSSVVTAGREEEEDKNNQRKYCGLFNQFFLLLYQLSKYFY
jgi:hypothetical protein